jgi:16S rRNA (guanine1207-N2)-methyltransferase
MHMPGRSTSQSSDHSLSLPTQLLQRHLGRVSGRNVLVAGLRHDNGVAVLSRVFSDRSITFLAFDYAAYLHGHSVISSAKNLAHTIVFSSWYRPTGQLHDSAIVYLQKGKELNQLLLGMVAMAIMPSATVFLVGENSAGIRSSREFLEDFIGPVSFSDAARHSVVYEAHAQESPPIKPPKGLDSWAKRFPVHLAGREVKVVSLPGVFSYGRMDKGTELLLNHVPKEISGEVLDFGSGSGIIGCAVKTLHENCRISLTDSNAFAIEASIRTFQENNVRLDAILPSNIFSNISGVFDVIISNPPFHQGIGTDYEVVSQFLSGSAQHLRESGSLLIVANRFLRYEPMMERSLGPTTVVAKNQSYKVLLSRKHRKTPT